MTTDLTSYIVLLSVEIGRASYVPNATPPALLNALQNLEEAHDQLLEEMREQKEKIDRLYRFSVEANAVIDEIEKMIDPSLTVENFTIKSLPDRIRKLTEGFESSLEALDEDCDCDDCDCDEIDTLKDDLRTAEDDLKDCESDYAELDETNTDLEDRLDNASYAIADYLKLPFGRWQDHHWFLAQIGNVIDPDRFRYTEDMTPFDSLPDQE